MSTSLWLAAMLLRTEPYLWALFLAALAVLAIQVARRALASGEHRTLLILLGAGASLRALAPFVPTNWYAGVGNVDLGERIFTRSTTHVPWPQRVLEFDRGEGIRAAVPLNLFFGIASIALLWHALRKLGYRPRVAAIAAGLLASIPMYVRYAASDASHTSVVFLFAAAAGAYAELVSGPRRAWAYCVLVTAVLLGVPVRAESSLLFLSIPLLRYLPGVRLRAAVWSGLPTVALLAGAAMGALWLFAFQLQSVRDHARLDAWSPVIALVARGLFLPTLSPTGFFPSILAFPLWLYVVRCLRERSWDKLRALYLPIVFCSIPSMFGRPIFFDLPSAGYNLLAVLPIVIGCAVALDDAWERGWNGFMRLRSWQRGALASVAAAVVAVCFGVPTMHTYAYQEEFRFLRRALPKEPATVLVIWDPHANANDFDCCLAMPYPALWAENPHLRWVVVQRDDLFADRVRLLRFDYYYPGSMAAADPASYDSWRARVIVGDPENRERMRAHLRAIQDGDALIRALHPMTPVRTEQLPANTFSSAQFAGDKMTLTLYRTGAGAPAAADSSGTAWR